MAKLKLEYSYQPSLPYTPYCVTGQFGKELGFETFVEFRSSWYAAKNDVISRARVFVHKMKEVGRPPDKEEIEI